MASRTQATLICADMFPNEFTMCLSNDGDVYTFGNARTGAYGHKEQETPKPTLIPSLKCIKLITCGLSHSVCLNEKGEVFTFGQNAFGQLGVGKEKRELKLTHIPQKVKIPRIKQLSSGNNFTACVSEDGYVYSFGELNSKNAPRKIESLKNVDFVECGALHVICKTLDNTLYGFGNNSSGQLGLGHCNTVSNPVELEEWPEIIDVKCGCMHTIVLSLNQEVFSCGYENYGQLGREVQGDNAVLTKIEGLSEIVRIECAPFGTMCIDSNYELYVFGANEEGQLGLGDKDDKHLPIKNPSLSNIIDISSGGFHTFVKTINNEIFAFGLNTFSQFGKETERNQLTPIRVLEDNEDIWFSNINKSKAKSARSILPRPSNEEDNSSPKKKQKINS